MWRIVAVGPSRVGGAAPSSLVDPSQGDWIFVLTEVDAGGDVSYFLTFEKSAETTFTFYLGFCRWQV